MFTYLFFLLASVFTRWAPHRLGYWLADTTGRIAYYLLPLSRRGIKANLRHVLGPEASAGEIARTAKSCFRTAAKNYYDVFRVPRLRLSELERVVKVDGWDHLTNALKSGKGAIVFSAHLGNLELVAQILVARNMRGVIPVEHVKPERLHRLVTSARAARGLRLIALDEGALRGIYKALRHNEIVGMGADRDIQGIGVRVRFFDKVTRMPDAPAILGLRSGAPVLPVRCQRLADNGFQVTIHPPLELVTTGNIHEDVRVNTEAIVRILEDFIRPNPGQWVVFRPIWSEDS